MPTITAPTTHAELTDWLTQNIGGDITNDYDAATQLLTAFDFAAKDGPSLNNRNQIATVLAPTPAITSQPFTPYVPLTAEAAAQHLLETFRVTRKPANYQQILVDLPMPVVVQRHQCPFCRRYTRADPAQVTDHMSRCWHNPGLRCCKTCTHHQDASGTPGSPDEWLESCTHPDGPEYEDYTFPALHCPLWQAKGSA
jgi:hypothetical protein